MDNQDKTNPISDGVSVGPGQALPPDPSGSGQALPPDTSGHGQALPPDLSNLSNSTERAQSKPHKLLRLRYVLAGVSAIIVIIAALLIIPPSRYSILGNFMTRHYTVQILSSAGHTPVVGARVTLGSRTSYSGKTGKVSFQVPVGHTHITISKLYYARISRPILVSIEGSSTLRYVMRVTGIVVPVEITNRIGGAPIQNALISTSKSSATSSGIGRAQLVLPASRNQERATLSAPGFISTQVNVSVTNKLSLANLFTLTPVGRVYYLSDASGPVNIMSSNLDGSDPKVVLPGTGKEYPNSTQLIVSDDSKYLALLANRDGLQTHLYVFSAQNPNPEEVNAKASGYQVIGWTTNDILIFQINNSSLQLWQPGAQDLMSFDPATNISRILYSSQAVGTSTSNYANQNIYNAIVLPDNKIVYEVNWYQSYQDPPSGPFNDYLYLINSDGSGSQTLYTAGLPSSLGSIYAISSSSVLFSVYGPTSTNYFLYENGQVTSTTNQTYINDVESGYNNVGFYSTPDGKSMVSSQIVNGHNALYISDLSGANKVQIATFGSNYSVYGFSSNPDYIIIAKNQDELYAMPISGLTSQASLVQVGSFLGSGNCYQIGCGGPSYPGPGY